MNIAILLSGGFGTRLGGEIPKQYIEVYGRPVIAFGLKRLCDSGHIDQIQIVAAESWQQYIGEQLNQYDLHGKFHGFSVPGENRQMSIYHALCDIREVAADADYVFIHDAARPLLSERQVEDCINAASKHEGAMPVLAMKDTVYESDDGNTVARLLERTKIFAGQAPEVFVYGKYYEANQRLLPERILAINGSTEPAILAGMDIAMAAMAVKVMAFVSVVNFRLISFPHFFKVAVF